MVLHDGHSQDDPHLQTVEPFPQQVLPLEDLAAVGLTTTGAGAVFFEQQDIGVKENGVLHRFIVITPGARTKSGKWNRAIAESLWMVRFRTCTLAGNARPRGGDCMRE